MKNSGDPLDRLLQAAARAPRGGVGEPAPGLESRCLAAWRSARDNDDSALLLPWLRRALAGAVALVLLSAAWNLSAAWQRPATEVFFEDAAVQIALNQP